jgi:late competence protein required for DNA uptake (superfamily II DNA/RNA helicase)
MKRGKCPSLISGKKPKLKLAKAKRTCKRCDNTISKGERYASIPIPGSLGGSKTYCCDCLKEIIDKTILDLNEIEKLVITHNCVL